MKNTFSNLLTHYQSQKSRAIEEAKKDLLEKNNMDNPKLKGTYRFEERKVIGKDGRETIAVRLIKILDQRVLTIDSKINIETKGGERVSRERQPQNTTSPL